MSDQPNDEGAPEGTEPAPDGGQESPAEETTATTTTTTTTNPQHA